MKKRWRAPLLPTEGVKRSVCGSCAPSGKGADADASGCGTEAQSPSPGTYSWQQ